MSTSKPPSSRNSRTHGADCGSCSSLASDAKDATWRKLVWFSMAFAIGWAVALVFHGLIATAYRYSWPESSFLFNPGVRYTDWTISWAQGNKPNPYLNNPPGLGATYFPFAYIAFRALGSLTAIQAVLAYFALSFVAIATVWICWFRRQRKLWRGDSRSSVVAMLTLIIIAFNYPMLFAIDRGNIDPLMLGLVFAALELAKRRYRAIGGLVLAIGAASKAFPLAALLYWVRRRWLVASVVTVIGFLVLIAVPAAIFQGELVTTLRAFRVNMGEFRSLYVLGRAASHYSADWLGATQAVGRWYGLSLDIAGIVYWYEKATTALAVILSVLAVFVVRESWRELLAIVLIMLVFPNVTNDYKLVFLTIPLLEWFGSPASGWRAKVFGIGCVLLMLPKHYYFPAPGDDASISCVINPLLVLLISAALWPTSYEFARAWMLLREFPNNIRRRWTELKPQ